MNEYNAKIMTDCRHCNETIWIEWELRAKVKIRNSNNITLNNQAKCYVSILLVLLSETLPTLCSCAKMAHQWFDLNVMEQTV